MSQNMITGREVKRHVNAAKREAIPWVVWLARFGYAAKGVVYLVVGALALQAAIGSGGSTTGPEGALQRIGQQPFGQVLLILVAIGLFGYALWRLVQAWVDPEVVGSDMKGVAQRTGYAISGISYSFLGVVALRLVMGAAAAAGGDNQQTQDWTARLMALPFGRWLVGLIGLAVIGVGLFQIYYGYQAKFRKHLKLQEMSQATETWATRAGRFGYMARGVVYAIIGGFLINAARQFDPDQVGGIGEALAELAQQPYGPWLLGIVALGLIAYSLFAFVDARYRRIYVE